MTAHLPAGSVAAYGRHTGDAVIALHLRPITPPMETNTR